MDIQESLNKLFALHTFGVKLGLENIQKFLEVIGNPQSKLKTIHVAGSNGKGSTSSFIASILMENGFKETATMRRMSCGDEFPWMPEKIYSRIGGYLG